MRDFVQNLLLGALIENVRFSQLDTYARQTIPSVRILLEQASSALAPVLGALMNRDDSKAMSDLEEKRLAIMAENYTCDLDNDLMLYKRFRESHLDKLSRWHAALQEHKRKAKNHDWSGASSFAWKYLKILGSSLSCFGCGQPAKQWT